ncbi:MAG TPA: excisionase family DNA-binding protein [Tissierellales bacterium]|nr:excisionase family DNA-binding protein [Tissierellales bacterium]
MQETLLNDLIKEIKELNNNIYNFNKNVFNAKEAADYLSIGYDTILRMTRIGEIDHVRNGSNYIYKKEFLDRWLDKNTIRRVK